SRCGAQRPSDGRWLARPCKQRRPFVCRRADDSVVLVPARVRGDSPPPGCGAIRTGRENEQARAAAGGRIPWVFSAPRR
ncbi:MAG TPA: hypothetical protein VF587_20280, partial [Solirubrobacteraceae bacterium]